MAFFAALGITLGHLVYQTQAPELIRKNSRDEYVSKKRQSFREQPYEADLAKALSIVRNQWWESDLMIKEETLPAAKRWSAEKRYSCESDMQCVLDYVREQTNEATIKIIRSLEEREETLKTDLETEKEISALEAEIKKCRIGLDLDLLKR